MGQNVNYLLGNQSQMLGADPELYRQQLIQQEQQRVAALPAQNQLGATIGGLLGRGIGNVANDRGFFEVTNPVLQKLTKIQDIYSASVQEADPNDPLSFYTTLQKNFADAGLGQQAMMAAQEAQRVELNQATIQQKTREKTVPTNELVNQGLYAVALKDAKGNPELAAQLYNERELAGKTRVSAASATPAPGSVPLDVLKQGRSIVKDYTGDAEQTLKDIKVIAATGNALKTNSTLLPQFQTQIAQFTKDKQIGYKQIQNALGSAGIGSDVVEGFNKFIEGKPTNIKIDDVLRGVKALEKVYGQEYNRGIENARTLLTQGKISDETQKALLPSPYKFPVAPPKVGEVRGGYRFKGGDPSQKENYEAVR